MKDILRVKNLNKSYKNFSLTDVSFSLSEGCITGFIGINGAGKTTTLRTILNLAKKDSGNIQFLGLDMDKNEQQIKNRIGVVLDDGCFYEELSMAEMKSILASVYTDWSEQDFKHYMDMFSLDPKRKINTLSKGMKMKYALTLALSHNAELLIMDEPTSGLDPLSRSQLLNVLNDYMENGGKGVLFSTHITSDLDKIADMLIMIHNGRIVFQEEKDFLLDDYRIIKGDKKLLTENIRQLFLNITETAFGFTGVTRHAARVQSYLPDAITERPTIEDIMLAAAVLIPPFMLWRVPEYAGILGFMLSVIFCVLILLQYISLKEYQFPKAASLLCAATFSRKMMVLSLYIFCIAVYVVCCTIYTIEALIIPGLDTMNAAMFFLMFLVTSVLISIYLPIQYKPGYEKTKFAFTVVIIASPFLLPQLMKMENFNLNFLSEFSPILICGSVLLLSCMILAVSAALSIKFYNRTDLA